MKNRIGFLLCLSLLPLLVGCRSYGPKLELWAEFLPPGATNRAPAPLPSTAFTLVEQTNQIRPEWLQPSTNSFRLGPGDALEIEVLGETGSRASATVGPDGKVYYSFLPGVFVWGLTLPETRNLLASELGKVMRVKPEVAVTLRTVESQRVWLLGSVQRPGVYPLGSSVSLIEAISQAGGAGPAPGSLTGVPNLRRSFLLRDGQRVQLDFQRLLAQGDLSQNLYLQPDDFIYLQSDTARNVYVLGAVPQPSIVPYSDRLSLFGAIASSGGRPKPS
jgi:protein involved in polysaccharide export with SLBB domain